jgi:hypothetical protein
VTIRAEGHSCRNGEACSHIFDLAVSFQANDFANAESRKASRGGEFERIDQTVGAEANRDNRGEARARTRYSQLLQLGAGIEAGCRVRELLRERVNIFEELGVTGKRPRLPTKKSPFLSAIEVGTI